MNLKCIDDKLLMAAFEDGCVYIWDLIASKLFAKQQLHSEPVLCIDFDNVSCKGISGSADKNIEFFSLDLDKQVITKTNEVVINNAGISDVKIRQDKKIAVTVGWDHRVRIFNWKNDKPLAILKYHDKSVTCVDLILNSNLIASGSADHKIALWSVY